MRRLKPPIARILVAWCEFGPIARLARSSVAILALKPRRASRETAGRARPQLKPASPSHSPGAWSQSAERRPAPVIARSASRTS